MRSLVHCTRSFCFVARTIAVAHRQCHTRALFQTAALQDRLKVTQRRYAELEKTLSDVQNISPSDLAKLSKEFSSLAGLQAMLEQHVETTKALRDTEELIQEEQSRKQPDDDIIELAQAEHLELKQKQAELEQDMVKQLVPRDDADDRGAVVEVRAGAGGDEASLFAADMFEMYRKVSDLQGWRTEVMYEARGEGGGLKEASLAIRGSDVFRSLKFESGVHRVQRVPVNDVRIHTSTMSVVVMPEAEEADIELKADDVKVDTYRAGGAGGQHVNTTNSAVRLTHIPTGIVVAIQDERSQHQNRAKAERILRTRLYEVARLQREKEQSQARSVIGSGDRSERIRTYNFPQDRVTDHRIGYTIQGVERMMNGEALLPLIEKLQDKELEDRVARLFSSS